MVPGFGTGIASAELHYAGDYQECRRLSMNEFLTACYRRMTGIREYAQIPLIILVAAMVSVWLVLIVSGAHPVRINPDTDTYRYFDFSSIQAMLTSIRTLGYPVLLRVIWVNTGSVDLLPAIQLALILIGVFLYFYSIRRYSASPWIGLCAALPILNSSFIAEYYDLMSSDAIGCALMICTVSMTVLCAVEKRRVFLFALGLSLFLTYQFRPAYLFLVLLMPCVYVVLLALKKDFSDIGRRLLGVSAACR